MATHSSILTWRIPWTEEPGGLQSVGSQKTDRTEQLSTHAPAVYIFLSFSEQSTVIPAQSSVNISEPE